MSSTHKIINSIYSVNKISLLMIALVITYSVPFYVISGVNIQYTCSVPLYYALAMLKKAYFTPILKNHNELEKNDRL